MLRAHLEGVKVGCRGSGDALGSKALSALLRREEGARVRSWDMFWACLLKLFMQLGGGLKGGSLVELCP